ncbi:MAG TPA: hypothetical protein DCQ26_11085 [Marinilabiliales bacterium]|nr:MAG: hypothetical protein A2W95_00640 [Bacteroidetes bacterium GWA2_40_14]OFX71184.1 MAG: hypothetical protein A2W96_15740 [Bacteroidetes bacterium GWD2_40_43]OFX92333.1 MAG: hypothetical protein A2W97_10215 [Bacteroidetes bacterium GWE2_40_63]OFY22936.1 MAG: hypothetical protein A2W88_04200 [Bacteroidetes bacterium GWF2_40_13]OFZ29974.1 MAG: hypothetical protein A2437_00770 [Bacteroidetes bacterium RIFOXYC2_FULL_40_12]HAM99141.1 hypothetical protein [Marinilabiliales bacterium]
MKPKIRILHVDDSFHDRILIQDALEKEQDEYEVIAADSREKFEKYLLEYEFDLVLSDFNILGFDGLRVLDIVKNKDPELPVIIVTGTGSEEIAIQAIKMGASDYVIKTAKHIRGLSPTIKSILKHKAVAKEHKIANELLKESEQLFKSLSETVPVGIFRTDTFGNTTYVNPRWCEIAGIDFQQAVGTGWLNAIHPDDRNPIIEGWKQAVADNSFSVAEYRFLKNDGTIAWVNGKAVPQKDESGKIIGYIGTTTDITERKAIEENLKENEKKFRKLIELAPVGFVVSDSNQNGIMSNIKFKEITGYTIDDIPSVDEWWLRAYPDEEYREKIRKQSEIAIERAMKTHTKISPIESMVTCKDGSLRCLEIGFEPIGGINIISFIDITDRKNSEDELLSLKNELEERVKEQTKELKIKIQELEKFHEITLNREFRITELREEVKRLKNILDQNGIDSGLTS